MTTASEVKFLNLQRVNSRHRDALIAAATRVIDSGWYILGSEVNQFEQEFARYCGAQHCISVGNGLDALTLILKSYIALGRLNAGDKVAIPSNTFIATVLAASQAGLTPVLLPPDEHTYNLSCDALDKADLTDVKAIIAVHLYGQLADVEKLKIFCSERNLLLIEDAAQAHGASSNGIRAGNFGDAAGFSFFPGKNLGALGDAGAIVTNNDALADICRALRNYGSVIKYKHDWQGMNSRLDEMHAALLTAKLAFLDEDTRSRRSIAQRYLQRIQNPALTLPFLSAEEAHVWHLFVVRCKQQDSLQRDRLQTHLIANGVHTLIHYPIAIPDQLAYRGQLAPCPIATRLANEVLSLPMDPTLTDSEVDQVVDACNSFIAD